MLRRKDTGSSAVHTHDRSDGDADTATERRVEDHRHDGAVAGTAPAAHRGHVEARDRFGGINWGAGFFGWLVAIGVAILLIGIIGAIAAAVGSNANFTQTDAEREAGTIGITAGIVLLAVLAIAYFVGGYVAGRMSRFDGGKQGLAVWLIGLVLTLLAVGLGALFGNEYNVFERIDLPSISLSTEQLTWSAALTALAVVVLTLLAAMLGGKLGHRYHDKVDRVAHR